MVWRHEEAAGRNGSVSKATKRGKLESHLGPPKVVPEIVAAFCIVVPSIHCLFALALGKSIGIMKMSSKVVIFKPRRLLARLLRCEAYIQMILHLLLVFPRCE